VTSSDAGKEKTKESAAGI